MHESTKFEDEIMITPLFTFRAKINEFLTKNIDVSQACDFTLLIRKLNYFLYHNLTTVKPKTLK